MVQIAKAAKAVKMVERYYGTGRRKTASARVFLKQGSGRITVNQRPLDVYFTHSLMARALQPIRVLGLSERHLDLQITVEGGGVGGQAEAIAHGIARALTQMDPIIVADAVDWSVVRRPLFPTAAGVEDLKPTRESVPLDNVFAEALAAPSAEVEAVLPARLTAQVVLRKIGLLTRDARKVERKKYGHRKARKVEQYSKR